MKKISKFILLILVVCAITLTTNFEYRKHANKNIKDSKEEVNKEKEEYINVWTTLNVDVKKEPNEDSEIVGKVPWNTELAITYINEDWAKIKYIGYYIHRDFISKTSINYVDRDVPSNNTIKSYMDYKTITSTSSRQYKLQQIATTDEQGIRKVNDRYCVAVGSYYTTTIGQYIDIKLENGEVIQGILVDCKADKHTDSTNRMHPDGSVVEFVVDAMYLDDMAKIMGDISYINNWNSKVVNIRVYDKIEDF